MGLIPCGPFVMFCPAMSFPLFAIMRHDLAEAERHDRQVVAA